jgi:hypothetical protein
MLNNCCTDPTGKQGQVKQQSNNLIYIYMKKQLYTTQGTGPTIPIVRASRRAILVAYNQPSLNQLDREVLIVQSNFSCNSTEFFIL